MWRSARSLPSLLMVRRLSNGPKLVQVDALDRVAVVTLNRPEALNALNDELIGELNAELVKLDHHDEVGAIVLTGSIKSFAAGADIKQMVSKSHIQAYMGKMLSTWQNISQLRTPLVAAVNGYALGGGCELAMMCDIIYAGNNAKFGLPEISLGTIPGCGGTQRLIRSIGKSRAMEMILTGEMITAEAAEKSGLVARVFKPEDLVHEVVMIAQKIAHRSKPIAAMAKQAVNGANEMPLSQGLIFERELFYSTFATNDRKEGMEAFVAKRPPKFTNT